MMKTIILINVGTPQSPEPEDVGKYLKEFLMDENILPLPRPFRDILVKLLIVPRRKFASSEKYKEIWTQNGSPLMVESEKLKSKIQNELGSNWQVVLGMQVGQPSLKKAISKALEQKSQIYFCPLYPQYASATTGGAIKALPISENIKILKPFYNENWFIDSIIERIKINLKPNDHILVSYHGLPVSQLKKKNSFCESNSHCCKRQESCELNCYKAQCFKTTESLAKSFRNYKISTSFQSRLGSSRWTGPASDDTIDRLLKEGVQNLTVVCPSFVADCLETLEEVGIMLKQRFINGGGENFNLVPCVNDSELFVRGLAQQIMQL